MTQPPEESGGDIIRLPRNHTAAETTRRPPTRHAGGHGFVVTLMAIFALVGIGAMFAFITVKWPEDTGRYVMGVFVLSVVGFISCASIAVFTAARGMVTSHSTGEGDTGRSAN